MGVREREIQEGRWGEREGLNKIGNDVMLQTQRKQK